MSTNDITLNEAISYFTIIGNFTTVGVLKKADKQIKDARTAAHPIARTPAPARPPAGHHARPTARPTARPADVAVAAAADVGEWGAVAVDVAPAAPPATPPAAPAPRAPRAPNVVLPSAFEEQLRKLSADKDMAGYATCMNTFYDENEGYRVYSWFNQCMRIWNNHNDGVKVDGMQKYKFSDYKPKPKST